MNDFPFFLWRRQFLETFPSKSSHKNQKEPAVTGRSSHLGKASLDGFLSLSLSFSVFSSCSWIIISNEPFSSSDFRLRCCITHELNLGKLQPLSQLADHIIIENVHIMLPLKEIYYLALALRRKVTIRERISIFKTYNYKDYIQITHNTEVHIPKSPCSHSFVHSMKYIPGVRHYTGY